MRTDLFEVPYGSKLYGTNTASSDTDNKVVYLPGMTDLLLNKKMQVFKLRFDAEGNKLQDNDSMPPNGVETEYFSLQTFVRDYVRGQTYAMEVAFYAKDHGNEFARELCTELVDRFTTSDVHAMAGFAMKQTFDYVRRGDRLNEAQKVLDVLVEVRDDVPQVWSVDYQRPQEVRLDTPYGESGFVLDYVAQRTGLPLSTTTNNNRVMRTLELNGRSYLESTQLSHLEEQVRKLVKSYGDRTNAAAKTDVDFKSLSHAVRVYQQATELLDTGKMTFPRPNAAYLLTVKQGLADMEEVKTLLRQLDDELQEKLKTTKLQARTPAVEEAAEQWLLTKLLDLYKLERAE